MSNFTGEIVIGILTQHAVEKGLLLQDIPELEGHPFVVSSYMEFVQSCGAQCYIIDCDISENFARKVYDSIHGLILPGGAASLKFSNYQKIARLFLKWSSVDYDLETCPRYFPILGICLGHQLLLRIYENENDDCLAVTNTHNVNLPIKFNTLNKNGRLFKNKFSGILHDYLTAKQLTFQNHKFSILPETFQNHRNIKNNYRVIATSEDPENETEFIAAIEGKRYPHYGIQWHPEKNGFEVDPTICHSKESVECSKYIIEFFLDECRKNRKVQNCCMLKAPKTQVLKTTIVKGIKEIMMIVQNENNGK